MLDQVGAQNTATAPAAAQQFRIDVPLYTLLQKTQERSALPVSAEPVALPDPVFPQIKRTKDLKQSGLFYHANNGVRAFRRWLMPYIQSRIMADALRAKGLPVAILTFAGEQHGFRKRDTIVSCLEAELYFYGAVFGFKPADRLPPTAIENISR